jgi:hypothetical protein
MMVPLPAACAVLLLEPAHAQDERDLDVLLDRLATYLESYEQELSTLVADEQYVQEEQRRDFGRYSNFKKFTTAGRIIP